MQIKATMSYHWLFGRRQKITNAYDDMVQGELLSIVGVNVA